MVFCLKQTFSFIEWLAPSQSGEMARCTACNVDLRAHVQDLKAHTTTAKHARNMRSRAASAGQTPLAKFVTSQPRAPSSSSKEVKITELRLAAHIAVHSSIVTADHLTPLVRECFKDSGVASSLSMGRTKCTALINKVLGPTFKQMLLDDIKGRKFSLILDESTDVSSEKELAVVIRYYSHKKSAFVTAFLGLVPVFDCSASGLFTSLKQFLEKCHLPIADCVGIGTDGASVMCGQYNSLYSRMREVNPNLVLVKCVCHSLQLACNEAVDVLPSQIDYLVRETFNWFSHSPKRQQLYKGIYGAINSGTVPRKLVGVCATRWLSIAGALRAVLEQWLELKTHFNVVKRTEQCYLARMLSEMFNDEQNFLYVQFLSPIVNEFDRINKIFQGEDPDPSKLYTDLSAFVKCLLRRVTLPDYASPDASWEDHLLHVRACNLGTTFRDSLEKSSLCEEEKNALLERCRSFLIACIRSVVKRLPSNMQLLSDLHLLHHSSVRKFPFTFLYNAFERYIKSSDVAAIECEYGLLQCRLSELRDDSVTDFWKNVYLAKNSAGTPMFPVLSKLAMSLLTLPLSNASVERVFSHVTLTKTDLRNRMNLETLENILFVKFSLWGETQCCKEFVPSDAFLERFTTAVMYPSSATGSDT